MDTIVRLDAEEVQRIRHMAIERGVFYLLRPNKTHYNDNVALVQYAGNIRLKQFIPESEEVPLGAIMPCPGLLDARQEGLEEVALGITEHFGLVRRVLPSMQSWLRSNLSDSTQRALELDSYYAGLTTACLQEESLIRADLILDSSGSWRSCDPNAMPLGMAFIQAYADLLNNPALYDKYLTKLVNSGRVIIVSNLAYPNWPSHKFLSDLVTQKGGSMIMVPPEFIHQQGLDGVGLRSLYGEMGWNTDHIPNGWYLPDTLIRYVRERLQIPSGVKVVNAPGTRLMEAQLLTALAWLPGIEEVVDCSINTIQDAVVPGLIVKVHDGVLYAATDAHMGKSGNFTTTWVRLQKNLNLLEALATPTGTKLNAKSKWVVKAAYSSGFKGVRMTGRGGLKKASRLISATAASFIPEGEAFFVQPRLSSELSIEGVTKRVKLDLYLSGVPDLQIVGADLMATPKSQIAVHGGSDTDFWLAKYK